MGRPGAPYVARRVLLVLYKYLAHEGGSRPAVEWRRAAAARDVDQWQCNTPAAGRGEVWTTRSEKRSRKVSVIPYRKILLNLFPRHLKTPFTERILLVASNRTYVWGCLHSSLQNNVNMSYLFSISKFGAFWRDFDLILTTLFPSGMWAMRPGRHTVPSAAPWVRGSL